VGSRGKWNNFSFFVGLNKLAIRHFASASLYRVVHESSTLFNQSLWNYVRTIVKLLRLGVGVIELAIDLQKRPWHFWFQRLTDCSEGSAPIIL